LNTKSGDIEGMTFLERFQSGEREQVWFDLERLGGAVRQAQYLADARAVGEETMKRARHNVELLVERLDKLGYQFSSPGYSFADQIQTLRASMDHMDRFVAAIQKNSRPSDRPGSQDVAKT
jgi:hypothetical protein